MKRYHLFILLPAIALLTGCAEKVAESNSDFANRLKDKAYSIGQQELARFNAVDLVYKNIPELHTTIVPIIQTKRHIWTKTYRNYTHAEVIDVARSSSLIAPIAYTISFNYDQYSTQYRSTTDYKDSLQVSINDMAYEKRFSDTFTRYYACDENGNLIDSVPSLPTRPDYFQEQYNGEADLGVNPR